jgi:prevent-host-death family protein
MCFCPFDSWSYVESMKTVGVRELKNRLSEYIRQVRSGEGVLVTESRRDRSSGPNLGRLCSTRARRLAKRGLVTLGAPGDAKVYPALPRRRRRYRATQLLDEERGDR